MLCASWPGTRNGNPHSELGQDSIGHGKFAGQDHGDLGEQKLALWFISYADDQLMASVFLGPSRGVKCKHIVLSGCGADCMCKYDADHRERVCLTCL